MLEDKRNLEDLSIASGPGSLSDLAKLVDQQKLRDPYIFFDFDETDGRYQIGYGIVYPGCKTGGHVHDDADEIFHIINGYGSMTIGDNTFDIGPNDTFIIPMYKQHLVECTSNTPMKIFWIVCKVK